MEERYAGLVSYLSGHASNVMFPFFDDILTADCFEMPKKYIVVCPSAADLGRLWPARNFAEIISILVDEYQIPVLLVGSKNDAAVAENIISQCHCSAADIVNLCGKTSISQLFSIVRKAEILLSNDTGTAHVGA